MNHLDKIIAVKKQHIERQKKIVSLYELNDQIKQLEKPREFSYALQQTITKNHFAVIAEIKRASPSKGIIRDNFDPIDIALQYEHGGAACLSVLTDEDFFHGSDAIFKQVRQVCHLPMLRKDFIVDPYQIFESRALGADCILLIVAALSTDQLHTLAALANTLDMSVLIESHDATELTQAISIPYAIIGINNRNLHTFATSLDTSINLIQQIPKERLVISESGIHQAHDIALLLRHHIHAFLIGESLMRAENPGKQLQQLIVASKMSYT